MPDHARAEFPDRRLLNRWGRHWAIWFGCTSNCWANSASIFFPRTAASATFALKADCGFRRGRLLIVSPAPATMANFSQTTHLPRCADFPRHLSMFDRDVGVALAMQEELAREGGPAMARSTSLRGGRCRPRRRSGGGLPAGGSAHPRRRVAAGRRRSGPRARGGRRRGIWRFRSRSNANACRRRWARWAGRRRRRSSVGRAWRRGRPRASARRGCRSRSPGRPGAR